VSVGFCNHVNWLPKAQRDPNPAHAGELDVGACLDETWLRARCCSTMAEHSNHLIRCINARRLAARLVAGFLACLAGTAALAQSTGEQEAAARDKVLSDLPDWAAKVQFGRHAKPAPLAARAIGSYAKGCLAGATAMAVDGETWQVMRVARNRRWGHPDLIAFLEQFARDVPRITGWPGLLVGDVSQPRGGPMLTGHASHQVGLDADLWLTPMPSRRLASQERENMPATNMVRPDWMDIDPAVWTPAHVRLIRAAAEGEQVERIFVNPAIKKAICRAADKGEAGPGRAWLAKVRPIWGHNYHFHVRMVCPAGSQSVCEPQAPVPGGDGCGKEIDDWLALQHKAYFGPKPKTPAKPAKPKPPMSVDSLPAECRQVLVAR
jgi:penicillin-insensitive murein DD-endopeptidase